MFPLIWELDLWLMAGLEVARLSWGHFMTKYTKSQESHVDVFDNNNNNNNNSFTCLQQ